VFTFCFLFGGKVITIGELIMSDVTKLTVLVVDDHKTMRSIIVSLLKEVGFSDIDEAGDGGSALESLKQKKYGLIFSDWNMAPIPGIEFLKSARALPEYKSTPFIMVTAETKMENLLEAKNAGVTNYIAKPFTAKTLKEKLEKVFGAF
jgi:two-component system, chemotaxis family, chemotaxis protein CheY